MSYYTTIYPKGEFEETNLEVVKESIKRSEALLNEYWQNIIAMCAASPTDPREAVREFKIDLNNYLVFYHMYCMECFNSQYIESKSYSKEKQSLDWNHFEYSSDPEQGIKDEQKSIDYVTKRLIMYCAASPEKIFGNMTEDNNPVNPLEWLAQELDNLKEYLDESIYCKTFCELCVKYWDTHTEG